ncbi:MAG TPA: LytR C-terminal domain-containing protein [Longimicrobium sp.]|nr:LytR C-terminal domain-containing protein [Longimicrobium sp.]
MSKSKKKGSPAGRLQTVGIFVTLLAVAVLIGSLVAGIGRRSPAAPAPAARVAQPGPAASPTGRRIRVQVLNASGRSGLAREATRVLRDGGFDVVEFGNGSNFPPDSSVVLDRVGNVEQARRVADALGIRRVTARSDANLYLDVTVVLGRDWNPEVSAAP